jgi:phosphoglycolate phosphatase
VSKNGFVLFDLDGTLVDSHEAIYNSAISVLSQYSTLLPTKEEVFKGVGLPIKDLFSLYLDDSMIDSAVPEFRNHLREFGADKTKLLPNAVQTLEKFKSEGVGIGLISNKQTALANSVLEQQNIKTYFDVVIGSDLGAPKPSPEMINLTLSKFSKAKFFMMVGDRLEDMIAAKLAGIRGVFLENQWNPTSGLETLLPFKPKVIKNLSQVFQAFIEIKGDPNVR